MIARQAYGLVVLALILVVAARFVWDFSLVPVIFALLMAAGLALLGRGALVGRARSQDPYDLKELRRIEDRKEFERIELIAPEDADGKMCPHCGELYPAVMPICPVCKR